MYIHTYIYNIYIIIYNVYIITYIFDEIPQNMLKYVNAKLPNILFFEGVKSLETAPGQTSAAFRCCSSSGRCRCSSVGGPGILEGINYGLLDRKKTTKWIQLQNQIPIFWPFSWNYLCVASTTFLGRLGETSVSPMSCQDTEGTRPESPWFRTWQSGHPRTGRFVENWKLEGDPQVSCEIYLGIWW